MLIQDLIIYKWNDFSQSPLSEEEIKRLLKEELFSLNHKIFQEKTRFGGHFISTILFVQKGLIRITYNDIAYEIYPSHFVQIPRGGHEIKVCKDNSEFYQASLSRDIPSEFVKAIRERFPDVRCQTHTYKKWYK